MRLASTVLSLAVHAALASGVLSLTARGAAPRVVPLALVPWSPPAVVPAPLPVINDPGGPSLEGHLQLPQIDLGLDRPPRAGAPFPRATWDTGRAAAPAGMLPGDGFPVDAALTHEPPVLLAAPQPAYPALLRQAGLDGRVALEAVVDTAGRVEPGSIAVVSATHPAFVPPAVRVLAGALFRPARMYGRPVRVRVRLPVDFVVQRRSF